MAYISNKRAMNLPTCGGVEENETMLVSVMKIHPDTKLSDELFAGLAALKKCQHYTAGGNNTVESNRSILLSTPSLMALPFSAILSQC